MVLLIYGLPSTGKTTYLKKHFNKILFGNNLDSIDLSQNDFEFDSVDDIDLLPYNVQIKIVKNPNIKAITSRNKDLIDYVTEVKRFTIFVGLPNYVPQLMKQIYYKQEQPTQRQIIHQSFGHEFESDLVIYAATDDVIYSFQRKKFNNVIIIFDDYWDITLDTLFEMLTRSITSLQIIYRNQPPYFTKYLTQWMTPPQRWFSFTGCRKLSSKHRQIPPNISITQFANTLAPSLYHLVKDVPLNDRKTITSMYLNNELGKYFPKVKHITYHLSYPQTSYMYPEIFTNLNMEYVLGFAAQLAVDRQARILIDKFPDLIFEFTKSELYLHKEKYYGSNDTDQFVDDLIFKYYMDVKAKLTDQEYYILGCIEAGHFTKDPKLSKLYNLLIQSEFNTLKEFRGELFHHCLPRIIPILLSNNINSESYETEQEFYSETNTIKPHKMLKGRVDFIINDDTLLELKCSKHDWNCEWTLQSILYALCLEKKKTICFNFLNGMTEEIELEYHK